MEMYYIPIINRLAQKTKQQLPSPELYCQVLEHKWFLSEKANRDVGHEAAGEDYLENFGQIYGL
jgi:hypothetical protein